MSFEKVVCDASLRMRRQSDLRLFHREDHVVPLDVGDEGEECKDQRVQCPRSRLLERDSTFAFPHREEERDGLAEVLARELRDTQARRQSVATRSDVFRKASLNLVEDRTEFGCLCVNGRFERRQTRANALPHSLARFLHAQDVVE